MEDINLNNKQINIVYTPIDNLHANEYNPNDCDKETLNQITTSMQKYGCVVALVVNNAPGRKNIIIGGEHRWLIAKKLGYKEVPVVYVTITDIEREKELCLRLNKNVGSPDLELLAKFNESFLSDIGFTSQELDRIFETEDTPEQFNLQKELEKLNITKITVQKGDIYKLGDSKIMCGDSTIEADILKLMNGEKADLALTDPPYLLDYLNGKKKHGTAVTGFGARRDRRYLETDVLPPDFTEKWMSNIHKIQKDDFSIICYENFKNIRTIWNEMERYWKVRNMIVWHVPNRVQGFAAKSKFFNKHDIAVVGTSNNFTPLNLEPEETLLQNEYETALFAISKHPYWESYSKGKRFCPTDFIEFNAADEKSSGQGIIFGTKPIEILIPYIKVLTKRNDLIVEPFLGSGSTLIAATKMHRRCFGMEKSNVYCHVVIKRWETLTNQKAEKIV